jgi:hypothetical protein
MKNRAVAAANERRMGSASIGARRAPLRDARGVRGTPRLTLAGLAWPQSKSPPSGNP